MGVNSFLLLYIIIVITGGIYFGVESRLDHKSSGFQKLANTIYLSTFTNIHNF